MGTERNWKLEIGNWAEVQAGQLEGANPVSGWMEDWKDGRDGSGIDQGIRPWASTTQGRK